VASCNGAAHSTDASEWINAFDARPLLAGTPWAGRRLPVVSGSCASGFHALFLAAQLLAAENDEVVVLALDILSPASHENFDALRVLAGNSAIPWQPTSTGFIPGEAAVALRASRAVGEVHPIATAEPVLGQDIGHGDGLRHAVTAFRSQSHSVVVGQGTGPAAVDDIELSAIDSIVDRRIPLTTPQLHFGHSLGASGLLSLSLAALAIRRGELPRALEMPPAATSTNRPLAGRKGTPLMSALVVCRALSGACAVTRVGGTRDIAPSAPPATYLPGPLPAPGPEAAGHIVLRRIAAEAGRLRPAAPPDLLLVRADAPLVPSPRGSVGHRLLPHAVVEITPGSIPSLIARRWGYRGPALCLVGEDGDGGGEAIVRACRRAGRTVAQVRLRGTGYERELEWDVQSG
jgi:Beta-ketoacyl synthase, C-terminal domain